MASQVIGAFI
ncbi:hypothetical protein YPPY42_2924, partial [Yersinia pestis PY-42]